LMEYKTASGGSWADCSAPNTDVATGNYVVRVKQTGNNFVGTETGTVTVVVATYSINLDVTSTHTFPAASAGYGTQTAKSVTITNTGNQATGALTAALSGTNSGSFTLSTTSINNIVAGGTDTFTVVPNTGLALGTYTDTVTISGSNGITASFSVSFTVNPYGFATPADYRAVVSLAGGFITTTSGSSVFTSSRPVILNAFKMAKYETTYQLWKEVYDWALPNGYMFANSGVEGHGTDGTGAVGTAAERATRPVTTINWRDAIVWCNAYSEMSGKEAVYYTNDSYTTVLKASTNDYSTTTAADGAKMKPGADGYRLPTEAEWEYAARGGNKNDATNWGYTYSGSDTVGDVAWYGVNSYSLGLSNAAFGAHPVGTKAANSEGLYDMSGNVWEWCWDWYGTISTSTPVTGAVSGTLRVYRGGCWRYDAINCTVANRSGISPIYGYYSVGFRVVCPAD
jgi:formylglycine-generating enzyme required for sulfatase activity